MAPQQAKRKSIRARSAKSGPSARDSRPRPSTYPTLDTNFSSSKKDKRTIKRSSFVSKIQKANTKPNKRRRPSKKLVTNLESLADALPDSNQIQVRDTTVGDAKMGQKTLRSRPGALKRKEKLEKLERERFGKNMAQMVGPTGMDASATMDAESTTSSRWAALRSFISQTMEKKDEFQGIKAT
ncbi:MAG: hypothetical protein M1812_005786 [Candelaria pacifica]|nr:MAG: hypothetical protein M1812_005786 [Candelaria pacifica]